MSGTFFIEQDIERLERKSRKIDSATIDISAQIKSTITSNFVNLNKNFNLGTGTDYATNMTKGIADTSSLNVLNTPISASLCSKYSKYTFVGGNYMNTSKTILNTPKSASYAIGAWIKKDIPSDMPTGVGMRFAFAGATIDLGLNISQANLVTGYSTTATQGGATAIMKVQKELNGWAYVSVIITKIPYSVTSFSAYIMPTTNYVPAGTDGVISVMNWTIVATDTISYNKIYPELATESSIAYKNKNILTMGDSITALTSNVGWTTYLQLNLIPKSFTNVAVSGATWKDKVGTVYDGNPVYGGADANVNNVMGNQVQKILNGTYDIPDIIIIACGTNDDNDATVIETQFTSGSAYIDIATVDKKTYAGAMRYCIETLMVKYPKAQIFICTPIQGAEIIRPAVGQKAKCDTIKNVAERMSIPIIDCNKESGIYGKYETQNVNGRCLIDGLHPNSTGGERLGNYISREVVCKFIV